MTTVSIAMATFNGEKYLLDQIESLVHQTRPSDEIVIVDDGSGDQTLGIARTWSRTAPFPVRISVNEIRLGVSVNFEKALRLATGDVVFLTDQDDVWLPEKIARVLQEFNQDPRILLVLNNQRIADENLRPTPRTSFDVNRRRRYDLYGPDGFVAGHGCCIAIRRRFLDLALPVPHDLVGHDLWLLRLSALAGRQRLVSEPLQLYRRHEAAVSLGSTVPDPREEWRALAAGRGLRRARLEHDLRLLDALSARLQKPCASSVLGAEGHALARSRLDRERSALENRIRLYDRPWLARRTGAFRLLLRGDYRYRRGWKSFLTDLLKA